MMQIVNSMYERGKPGAPGLRLSAAGSRSGPKHALTAGLWPGRKPAWSGLLWLALAALAARAAETDVRRDATVAAIELVMPSVVNIATETTTESHEWYDVMRRQFYGVPLPQSKSISLGSGVIIDEEGYLLTNFHVVNGAHRVQVKLWDGQEYEAEPLVATPASDVALLRIRTKAGTRFKAIKFAHDDDLLLGETVLALGNPFGLGGSVTRGILSSKNRRPPTGTGPLEIEDWLETDAAINPGNSGGPLVNLRGELIGLNVAVSQQNQGMGLGFSIPIKQVSFALSRFFRPEFADSLWFGAQMKASPGPLLVTAVCPGSPAARAGLRENDQVVQVNGQVPTGIISFNRWLTKTTTQDNRLVVSRGGERLTVTVRMLPLTDIFKQKLGFAPRELDAKTASGLGLSGREAMVADDIERDGPAARAGLQKGTLLASLDGQAAQEIHAWAELLLEKKKGDIARFVAVVRRPLAPGYVEARQVPVEVKVR